MGSDSNGCCKSRLNFRKWGNAFLIREMLLLASFTRHTDPAQSVNECAHGSN